MYGLKKRREGKYVNGKLLVNDKISKVTKRRLLRRIRVVRPLTFRIRKRHTISNDCG
jgi:hypothetical protein